MARYLYGDSQPFPNGYDFLTELRQLVGAASQALALSNEAEELEHSLGDRAQEHLHAIEALQSFFDGLAEAIADRAARANASNLVMPYARELLQQVEAMSERARAGRAQNLDADQVDVTSHIRDRRTQLRSVLSAYLLTDPLVIEDWALSLTSLTAEPQGQCVLLHPNELTTSFIVQVAADPTWGRPRKLSELVQGMALQVGWRKAFLRSSLHPDVATLDDLFVAAIEIGPDSMDVRLRKKPDSARDGFVLTVEPDASGPVAKIQRIDEKRGETDPPFTSQEEDRAAILGLHDALRRECAPLVKRKTRLVYAQLEGLDVFERGLVRALFERIATRLEPIAQEVSRHSPNPAELSLKLERDDGRREELYLNKVELIEKVTPLPQEAQELFYKLGFMPPPPTPSRPPPASMPPSAPTGGAPSVPPPPKNRL